MTSHLRNGRVRRYLIPEVIQTSSMDCGPAALQASFHGFGIELNYDQLREICQTDVDGTSVEALAAVANQLGLAAEQIYIPLDHLCIRTVSPFPALLIVRQPDGSSHIVVVWRRVGSLYQIMDPGMGRRWVTAASLIGMTYEHDLEVTVESWRQWAGGPEFTRALRQRMRDVDADESLIAQASADGSPQGLASLDASVRFVTAMAQAGGLVRGKETRELVTTLFQQSIREFADSGAPVVIPPMFFSALPVPAQPERVLLRGAVLIRLLGLAPAADGDSDSSQSEHHLRQDTVAGLTQRSPEPFDRLFRSLRQDGWRALSLIGAALLVSALLAGLEAVLLRASLEISRQLSGAAQRLTSTVLLLSFLGLLLAVDLWTTNAAFSIGRRLELRLRVELFAKLPRLSDRYFRSRPQSDMAHRAHALHSVRGIGNAAARLLRLVAELAVTVVALCWLHPSGAAYILPSALICILLPWVGQRLLVEHDLRVRTYDGSLVRFYLDALLGAIPVRAHGSERAVRWEHGHLLLEWTAAARARLRRSVGTELFQGVVSTVLAVVLIASYRAHSRELGATLLFVYWTLNMPVFGQEIALIFRQMPRFRNLLLRLSEPLNAQEEIDAQTPRSLAYDLPAAQRGVEICMQDVAVRATGRTILEKLDLRVAPGDHVAIIGASGAGKSSLVGLLLGWHTASEGRVLIDGHVLDRSTLNWLRSQTAWVDPSVMLWNRSLINNIEYSAVTPESTPMLQVLQIADLLEVLERMPDGLQTQLGEGGGLVSGGEGQRVRLARAMTRAAARLVVLDEPFRGLERQQRERLLTKSRDLWSTATLLCITHDIAETQGFSRVIVIENGRIVEDGAPEELAARQGSRYQQMLDAETTACHALWNHPGWRRLHIHNAKVVEL